jgi:hypothetical protein
METIEGTGSSGAGTLLICSGCSLPLPLRLPAPREPAIEWVCTGCGASYRGVMLESWPARYRRHVRPVPTGHQTKRPSAPPAEASQSPAPRPISIAFPDHQGIRSGLETTLSRQFDAEIRRGAILQVSLQGAPFAESIRKHGDRPYDRANLVRFHEVVGKASVRVSEFFATLGTRAGKMRIAESLSQEGLHQVSEDKDLFVNLGLTLPSAGYPSQHALRVGMLAMSIGTSLGWDERTLLDLGIGCLIHDLGMLDLEPDTYLRKRILAASDFARITEHPVRLFDLLQRHVDQIPETARLVAYQIHERCDGSGYPRGYQGDQIHELAKVAALADVFVALVSPRPHRPGMVPYHAMKKILQDTQRGLFGGAAVRGLLSTVSLFPIGSYVALNDGRVGKVIRSAEGAYDRPVIEAWARSDLSVPPTVVNLAEEHDLKVTNALARLDD